MTTVNIKIDTTLVNSNIDKLTDRLDNLQPIMSSIGEYMARRVRSRFDNETDLDGNAWAPLAQATIRAKQRKGSKAAPNAILKDTFIMRDTIAYQASKSGVSIGTAQKYGVHHQFGTKNIPARPFLGYNEVDVKEIQEIFADAVNLL